MDSEKYYPVLEQAYSQYKDDATNYALNLLKRWPEFNDSDKPTLAEDIVQNIFTDLARNHTEPENWQAFIKQAVKNKFLDELRKRRRVKFVELPDEFDADYPVADVYGNKAAQSINSGNKTEVQLVNTLTVQELVKNKDLTAEQKQAMEDYYIHKEPTSNTKQHKLRTRALDKLRRKINP